MFSLFCEKYILEVLSNLGLPIKEKFKFVRIECG